MRVRMWAKVLGPTGRTDKSAVAMAAAVWLWAEPALSLELQLPIDCVPGKTCFVQNYPDDDATGGHATDYACSGATYPGHDGTDFRVLSVAAARGVKVLAAAAGIVKGVRDGERDHLMLTPEDKAAIAGKECGNGVVIDHGDGWITQYCHMHAGSLRIHPGEHVVAGAVLGEVGQSGETQFAHVHLSVRHHGEKIDPFLGAALKSACQAEGHAGGAPSLWRADVLAALGPPATVLLETGFTDNPVTQAALEEGHAQAQPLQSLSPLLVLYARVMHLRQGDRIHFQATLPEGPPIDQTTAAMPRDQAAPVYAVARRRTGAAWPTGKYIGHVDVLRNGAAIASGDTGVELR